MSSDATRRGRSPSHRVSILTDAMKRGVPFSAHFFSHRHNKGLGGWAVVPIPQNGMFFLPHTRIATNSTPTDTCRTRKDTSIGVFSCSACTLHPATYAEHEGTPRLVFFRARHVFYAHQCTPNTKRHHRWCLFVLGVFSTPSDIRRTRGDTTVGVLSCSASFYIPQCTPNTRRHPRWCRFVLCAYPVSPRALALLLNIICILFQFKFNNFNNFK